MSSVDVLRSAISASHSWFNMTLADVTPAQAIFVPPGLGHPIGELAAHVYASEDFVINTVLQGKPTIWESEGWGDKLGLGAMNVVFHEGATARMVKLEPKALEPFQQAVYANTEAWLNTLRDADLDVKSVDMTQSGLGMMTVPDAIFMLFIANTFAHTGEISLLKGMQDAKGYPF